MARQPRHHQYNDTNDIPALGLWNTRGKGRYPVGAAQTAKNVDILPDANDKYGYEGREGYTQSRSFTNATQSYATEDGTRLFVINDGSLVEIGSNLIGTVLATGMGSSDYTFVEVGPRIYVLGANSRIISGSESFAFNIPQPSTPVIQITNGELNPGQYTVGIVYTDELGRQGPLSPVTTVEVTNVQGISVVGTVPVGYTARIYVTQANGEVLYDWGDFDGSVVISGDLTHLVTPISEEQIGSSVGSFLGLSAYYDGRLYTSQYVASQDVTYIFYSYSFWHNLYKPQSMYIAIQGKVNSMDSVQGKLVITTSRQILAYDGDSLETVADYGTIEGSPTATDYADDTLYLWTVRGVCSLFPLKNLTEEKVSLPPGSEASTAFLNVRGTKRFMVLTDTLGNSFNKY